MTEYDILDGLFHGRALSAFLGRRHGVAGPLPSVCALKRPAYFRFLAVSPRTPLLQPAGPLTR